MQLSIIIVNYNVKYFLEQCLVSVIKACTNIKAEIFVVDNNSTDGSKEFFDNRFPTVKFLWESDNAGFAKANNKALKLATGNKILFLNPDTILPEDCLDKCLQFFSANSNTGALAVKMIDGSGVYLPESKRGFPTPLTSFFKITGLAKLFPSSSIAARYYLGNLPQDKNAVVDVVAGAFMMIDKKVVEKTGCFDEDYFMYAEDIDLSYRIQKAGYQNRYFAETTIIHFKGESTARQSAAYVQNFYGAMILFVQKHYSKLTAIFFAVVLKLMINIKLLLLRREKKNIAANAPYRQSISILSDEALFAKISTAIANSFNSAKRITTISELDPGESICFCEGTISFKDAICIMQEFAGKHSFFIHASNTRSIIGSTDKSRMGTVICLK